MGKIRLLSDRVANQIAAGEVVERPAAVVKELVENALDAGATRIDVEFNHGGRALISVEDNGHGMGAEDARLCLQRHATSKIAEASDLDRVSSFGFRGEAIPSIASVSRFTLQTREAGATDGVEILINGGEPVHERACGRPIGTRIVVEHLFHSVPARRKFLKSDQTEAAHIVSCVRLYALACPGTAFSLREDGRNVFKSPECPALKDRIAEIFSKELAEGLVEIDASEPGLALRGLIGRPTISRSSRHELVTFVNGRPVDSSGLNYALRESYRDTLPEGRYPVAFIFLDCDPASVDVNVHPAKREVRFRSDSQVRAFVIRSVTAKLRDFGSDQAAALRLDSPSISLASLAPFSGVGEPTASYPALTPDMPKAEFPTVLGSVSPIERSRIAELGWRFVGLAHGSYALFETSSGLVLLDRRAAHERVWFERIRAQFNEGTVDSQALLLPTAIELDPVYSALLIEHMAFFAAHGFEISEFGRHFFRIGAVPSWMEPSDAEPFIRDILGELREGRLGAEADARHVEFAKLAAAKAVRLPSTASEAELRLLAGQLHSTPAPLTSPSGRPTYVELSHSELSRRFQR